MTDQPAIDFLKIKPWQVAYVCERCGTRWIGPNLTPEWSANSENCQGVMVPVPGLPTRGEKQKGHLSVAQRRPHSRNPFPSGFYSP